MTTEEIAAAVELLDDRLIDRRDRAILLVGYAGGMRRAELASLDVADVAAAPEGLLIRLRRSKTDPEARGRRVEIVYGTNPSTCPVRAYRAWVRAAGFAGGAAFRRVDPHSRVLDRLSPQGVAIVVKRHMGRLATPPATSPATPSAAATPPRQPATGPASAPSWAPSATPPSRPSAATSTTANS